MLAEAMAIWMKVLISERFKKEALVRGNACELARASFTIVAFYVFDKSVCL